MGSFGRALEHINQFHWDIFFIKKVEYLSSEWDSTNWIAILRICGAKMFKTSPTWMMKVARKYFKPYNLTNVPNIETALPENRK